MLKWFSNLMIIVLSLSVPLGNCMGEPMNKRTLRKEVLRVEKEKNWRLAYIINNLEGVRLTTLEKNSIEIFKRKGAYISDPALSPDAKKVAFFMKAKWRGEADYPEGLYIIDSDGSNLELINDDFLSYGPIKGVCWSPDGKKISFVGRPKKNHRKREDSLSNSLIPQGLYVIDLETREVKTLVEDKVYAIYTQAWSNDSKEILYVNTERGIMIYNLESGSSRKLVEKGNRPSWSRDGKWIVFREWIIFKEGDPVDSGYYYIIHPDGSGKTLLLAPKSRGGEVPLIKSRGMMSSKAFWSPDNRYIFIYTTGVKIPRFVEYPISYIIDFEAKKIIKWGEGPAFTSWEGIP